ncbi:MAG: hypothetical protein K6G03_06790 [Lachnospiraceae bacterium]|nr:hypothetical protein [Lachnospiraceae bacterium]
MYFSKRTHIISYALMASAIVRLIGAMVEGLVRIFLNRNTGVAPDMMDGVLWGMSLLSSVVQIIFIAAIFIISWKKLNRYRNIVEEDDRAELGRLQEEFLGDNLAALSVESIEQLLEIWAVILVGAEVIYCVTSVVYRRFTAELLLWVLGGMDYFSFVSIYNLTHGFKYLEMITAILLGVAMTGIFLKDRLLKIATASVGGLFLLSFALVQMQTVQLSGRNVGIVWTSVIFHLTETVGIFILALYLSRHYRGL